MPVLPCWVRQYDSIAHQVDADGTPLFGTPPRAIYSRGAEALLLTAMWEYYGQRDFDPDSMEALGEAVGVTVSAPQSARAACRTPPPSGQTESAYS